MRTTAPRWLLALTLLGGPALGSDALPQKELNYGYASLYSAAKGSRVLQGIHRRIDQRYDEIVALLERKYFK